MSAITGIYLRDGRPVDNECLSQMTRILAHRGGDGTGLWSEGWVGLGNQLLATTHESRYEKLPLVSADGDFVLTSDSTIYNRAELMAALDIANGRSEVITDSDLILAAYRKWGDLCPEKLLGDFAFAIWDRRKQALFCARDHFGVKPFYYHLSNGMFAFASEIKAVIGVPNVPSQLSELRIAYHLQPDFLGQDKEITFYKDVFRLPPGHKITVTTKAAHRHSYWSLDPERELRLKSNDEYSDTFREIFVEAVRCRIRSAFPVGSTLSGGLDSSSIACAARDLLASQRDVRLHTFSAIFPGVPERELRKIDERPFVDAVVATGGFIPHYIRADCLSPLQDMEQVLWHEDEVVFAPNLYMHWGLYKEAHRQGVRVMLDGLDGDSTVSHGLEYLSELARSGKWISLVKEATALSRRASRSFPTRKIIWQYGLHPLIPEIYKRTWRRLHGRSQLTEFLNPIINPSFAKRVGLAERAQALVDKLSAPTHSARQGHCQGLNSGLFPYVLEIADKAAAAFSVSPRYPFFDRRLVEFCLAVPANQKLHQGWTRMIMRRAMAEILPNKVRWRIGKANLSPNFQLRLLDGHRKRLEDILAKDPSLIEEYIDVSALRRVYSRYVTQQAAKDALVVYGAATLALWLSEFTASALAEKTSWLPAGSGSPC